LNLIKNHWQINFFKQSNEIILYQFDVDVELFMRDGSWRSCKKDERLQALKTIIERENFSFVWYDEGKNIYSIENLTLNYKKEYQREINHKKQNEQINFIFYLLISLKLIN